jgi:hypothetical protein
MKNQLNLFARSRQITGHVSYYEMYLQCVCTTLPPILLERKQR